MSCCNSNCNHDPCGSSFNQSVTKAAQYAQYAQTQANAAAQSAEDANNTWLEFNALYLGSFAVAPTADNEGNPLQEGALYFNSVSNQMFVWQGGSWIDFDFDEFTPFLATGTTAPRNLVTRMADVVNVKDFGAVGDWNGTTGTNNRTAFQNAMAAASGKKLYIPSGRYLIEFTTGVCFTPPANIVIEGDGDLNTEIIASPQGFTPSQYPLFCDIRNQGAEINGIKITAKVATGNRLILIGLGASDVSINGCTLDGSVTHSGTTRSHSTFGISHGGDSSYITNNFLIQNSKLTRLTYPFLKDAASQASSNNWKIISNTFTTNYFTDFGLNSPSGTMKDIVISNNTFENNQSHNIGDQTEALGVALASIKYVTISNNHFTGTYRDAIHVEEDSDYISIIGNTFSVNNGNIPFCKCIQFNANAIGGSLEKPNNVTIIGNNMYQDGPQKDIGTVAIGLVSENPASEIIISNNTMENFERGIYSETTIFNTILVEGNIIKNCQKGIEFTDGALTLNDNTTKDCDIGITNYPSSFLNKSATIINHVFINCVTNILPTDQQIVLINPKFIFSEFTSPAGTSYKTLLPAKSNDRIYGEFTITLTSGNSFNRVYDVEVITWNGTSLTWNDSSSLTPSPTPVSRIKYESGFSVSISRTGTNLNVEIYNISSVSKNRLQVNFNGSCMIQP